MSTITSSDVEVWSGESKWAAYVNALHGSPIDPKIVESWFECICRFHFCHFSFQSFFGFGQSAEVDIVLDGQESRKTAEIKTEDGKKERYYLYYDGETVSGKVLFFTQLMYCMFFESAAGQENVLIMLEELFFRFLYQLLAVDTIYAISGWENIKAERIVFTQIENEKKRLWFNYNAKF